MIATWLALVGAIAAGETACSGGTPGGADGPGSQDSASDPADKGKIISAQKPSCQSARTVCDGTTVYRCVDHLVSDPIEPCESACSLGRCTTSACAQAESQDGVNGCLFYGVQMDNIDADDDQPLMLLLSNAGTAPASVRVEVPVVDLGWRTLAEEVVAPGAGTRVELVRPVLDSGVTGAGAFRIQADAPVMAVQIVSDDANRTSHSSAGTVLRPAQAIGTRYLAVTSPAYANQAVIGMPGSRAGAASITVVATGVDTHVTVGLTSPATLGHGVVLDPPPTSTDFPPMQEGDVLQIFSATPDGDLTGTSITSDIPVAVFSGNVFTTYGYDLVGAHGGDLAQEQLPPTASWGMAYVGARLSPQAGCDPFFGPGVALWRVVAAEPDTHVSIFPAEGVSVDGPNVTTDLVFELGTGQFQSFWTRGNLIPPFPVDVTVRASKPILLAQWLDCEPGLSWGVDTRLSGGNLAFTLPPGFEHEVVVVRQTGESVALDGRNLPDSRFQFASSAHDYQVARIGAAELGPCDDVFDRCDHQLSGAAFGVTWRGMDVVCSYAVTVPSRSPCALPNTACEK